MIAIEEHDSGCLMAREQSGSDRIKGFQKLNDKSRIAAVTEQQGHGPMVVIEK